MAKKPSKPRPKSLLDREDSAPAASVRQYPMPIKLSEVLGQERALKVLADAVRSGRVHHAWIFHGPSGVGKFTTALAFAAVILDSGAKIKGDLPSVDPDSNIQQLL